MANERDRTAWYWVSVALFGAVAAGMLMVLLKLLL